MSARDQAVAAIVAQLALAADGAFLGVTLAYVAVRTFVKFAATSSALRRISAAPSVAVSDLRSLLSDSDDGGDGGGEKDGALVVVRGAVDAMTRRSLWSPSSSGNGGGRVLVSHDSSHRAVVILRSQKCLYNNWRGYFGWWYPDVRTAWREQGSISIRTVPFVLVGDHQQPRSDYVVVDLDGSKHPLPLTTVYHQIEPTPATPYTFLQALFGHEFPVGILDEEKILPLGKDVNAVGICFSKNGVPEIKSCKDLPYFLSEMTKDQMLVELSFKSKILLWSGIVVATVSVGVLGYAIVRNWNKWKHWRERRRGEQQTDISEAEPEVIDVIEDEGGDVPDGQLCVICLMRRRRSAFVPCGHLVCCQRCALSVERDLAPKCPVCRQVIRGSVRIYDS